MDVDEEIFREEAKEDRRKRARNETICSPLLPPSGQ
jgi:hypothetical protein